MYLSDAGRRSTDDASDVGVLVQDVDVMIRQNAHHRRVGIPATKRRTPCTQGRREDEEEEKNKENKDGHRGAK